MIQSFKELISRLLVYQNIDASAVSRLLLPTVESKKIFFITTVKWNDRLIESSRLSTLGNVLYTLDLLSSTV